MRVNSNYIRNKIIEICNSNKQCADNDRKLIAEIWKAQGWDDPELYEKLMMVANPETIRRTRQRLVQEGKIKPSAKITEGRYQQFKQVRCELDYEI